MVAKLNQIIAIEKGIKNASYKEITEVNKQAQKPDNVVGSLRTYQRKDEEGESLPPEVKKVPTTCKDMFSVVEKNMRELMQVTARKDWTNCLAKADIQIGDTVILKDVPVTFLLFLEKQLTDLKTFVSNLLTLDESEIWTYDSVAGLHQAAPQQTHRTKKIQRPLILAPATDKHPAQTQLITEDVIVGFWTLVKKSGALTKKEKQDLLENIKDLIEAVKAAREEANMQEEVNSPNVGEAIFSYILGDR